MKTIVEKEGLHGQEIFSNNKWNLYIQIKLVEFGKFE
jgi:hypothetical protein